MKLTTKTPCVLLQAKLSDRTNLLYFAIISYFLNSNSVNTINDQHFDKVAKFRVIKIAEVIFN